jgi:predicted TIM-barrel fold metal-dependent hydrolase
MIIDSHVHIFFDEIINNREVFFDDAAFKLLYNSNSSKIVSKNDLLHYVNKNYIESVFVYGFCWQSVERCRIHNEYLKLIATDKVIAFASVPSIPTLFSESFITQITQRRFIGIGELAFYVNDIDKEILSYLKDILQLARENKLILTLHVNEPVGHSYPGKYYTPFNTLYQLISDFPDVTIILAHLGGGFLFYEFMPEIKQISQNVYYDIAALPYLYSSDILNSFSLMIENGKLLFGSDFPLLELIRYKKYIKNSSLSKMQNDKLFFLNARNIIQKHWYNGRRNIN